MERRTSLRGSSRRIPVVVIERSRNRDQFGRQLARKRRAELNAIQADRMSETVDHKA
jgi:hypothetical protein